MRALTCFAAVLTVALAGTAQAEGLAVSPGLWEMSSAAPAGAAQAVPQIPADTMAKLTPQQQAMVQQRLAAIASGKAPPPRKICVTQAMIDKGFSGADSPHCTRKVVSSSATGMEADMVCTGDHPATGSFKLQVTDAHNVVGTIDMQLTLPGGGTRPIDRSFQGRWLSADCGDVKPPKD